MDKPDGQHVRKRNKKNNKKSDVQQDSAAVKQSDKTLDNAQKQSTVVDSHKKGKKSVIRHDKVPHQQLHEKSDAGHIDEDEEEQLSEEEDVVITATTIVEKKEIKPHQKAQLASQHQLSKKAQPRRPKGAEVAEEVALEGGVWDVSSACIRAVGGLYALAFFGLTWQVLPLLGQKGMLPVKDFVQQQVLTAEYSLWTFPSLFFVLYPSFQMTDNLILACCLLGCVLSSMITLDVFSKAFGNTLGVTFLKTLAWAVLWLDWLSLVVVGRDFLNFQWDHLLLEIGFLTILLQLTKPPKAYQNPLTRISHDIVSWLMRVLLLRVVFCGGVVKYRWWQGGVSTLFYAYYQSQPLLTPLGWYLEQLSLVNKEYLMKAIIFTELGAPFFMFLGKIGRRISFWTIITVNLFHMAVANNGLLNWEIIVLCILLLDDSDFARQNKTSHQPRPQKGSKWSLTSKLVLVLVLVTSSLVVVLSVFQALAIFRSKDWAPPFVHHLQHAAAPFHIVNSYGVLHDMQNQFHHHEPVALKNPDHPRKEMVFQYSFDGLKYFDFDFRYKPGNVNRAPSLVIPMTPRFEWLLYFGAQTKDCAVTLWMSRFMDQYLEGNPHHTSMLSNSSSTSPLSPSEPLSESPTYMRAVLFDYSFAAAGGKQVHTIEYSSGDWWIRKFVKVFCGPFSTKESSTHRVGNIKRLHTHPLSESPAPQIVPEKPHLMKAVVNPDGSSSVEPEPEPET